MNSTLLKKTVLIVAVLLLIQTAHFSLQARENSAGSRELQVYGQLRLSLDARSGDHSRSGTGLTSNASRLGVRGGLDLGAGAWRLIYQLEFQVDAVSAAASISGRDQFAGISHKKYGTLRLGRISCVYKNSLTRLDPWNDNLPQARAGGASGSPGLQGASFLHASYLNSGIDYASPLIMKALSLSAFWSRAFQGEGGRLGSLAADSPGSQLQGGWLGGLGLRYEKGAFFFLGDLLVYEAEKTTGSGVEKKGLGMQFAAGYNDRDWSGVVFHEQVMDLGAGRNWHINLVCKKVAKLWMIAAVGLNSAASSSVLRLVHAGLSEAEEFTAAAASLGCKYFLDSGFEIFLVARTARVGRRNYQALSSGFNLRF